MHHLLLRKENKIRKACHCIPETLFLRSYSRGDDLWGSYGWGKVRSGLVITLENAPPRLSYLYEQRFLWCELRCGLCASVYMSIISVRVPGEEKYGKSHGYRTLFTHPFCHCRQNRSAGRMHLIRTGKRRTAGSIRI